MTAEQNTTTAPLTAAAVESALLSFLAERLKTTVTADQDIFSEGLVSSMFAMQLVVHLEEEYDIAIVGPALKLDNFRTVGAMTEMVMELHGAPDAVDGA
ncbi:acyl carrier protein [Streptomyces sp. NPDC059788]|uniref:acyl carrier protein n=1 Tax=Streptomyces sp. NPDC059788 TaxID=3346948 RepID=UPI0036575863